ncbi:MAG: class I SAM-dependent methyltransferase [Anaerolineaceae bacterium]|nr:class I SAM-dependent methyltransferase [Anaerolineaceae bacterium]
MDFEKDFSRIQDYFKSKLETHGATAQGADWNSRNAQETRFEQLIKVIDPFVVFSILDFGCGYGALADYLLTKGYQFENFYGYDVLESMVQEAYRLHPDRDKFLFSTHFDEFPPVDYGIASGVFNIRLDFSYQEWTEYVLKCLNQMDQLTAKGFSANFLTKYSDPDRMDSKLYYADPCFLFDYCKIHFSKNVALLHDYKLYDFTILVRKYPEQGK